MLLFMKCKQFISQPTPGLLNLHDKQTHENSQSLSSFRLLSEACAQGISHRLTSFKMTASAMVMPCTERLEFVFFFSPSLSGKRYSYL